MTTTTTFKRTLLIGAASLALAPFAAGADTYRKGPAYDAGHGHGDRRADAVYRVKAVAADLADAAARAHRTAEHTIHYSRYGGGAEIIERLHDLDECAVGFLTEVRRNAYAPYRLRDDYHLLVSTYRKAAYALERGHTDWRVERAFARVSELIYDLRYAWDDAYGNGWKGAGHGRYDRDGRGYDRDGHGYDRGGGRVDIRLRLPWFRK